MSVPHAKAPLSKSLDRLYYIRDISTLLHVAVHSFLTMGFVNACLTCESDLFLYSLSIPVATIVLCYLW